ncbi:hypothetical protein CFOL_v3_06873 [Cephalotus follicularis]|uniref:CHCH domain-containing protein n=1 Tax=Cephalotus follicularis TaxID=3775 RepID=A0A1Q3B642_CEPFO|nr:hypothetical protein CFOL_v3_06873 [Cephalotus follicularis]
MDQPKKNPNPNPSDQFQVPASLHQSDVDDEDENVKQLKQCSSLYLSLQDCLVDSNRNWKACQKEVQALKACNERRRTDRGK